VIALSARGAVLITLVDLRAVSETRQQASQVKCQLNLSIVGQLERIAFEFDGDQGMFDTIQAMIFGQTEWAA
jgi:hypothetical protein